MAFLPRALGDRAQKGTGAVRTKRTTVNEVGPEWLSPCRTSERGGSWGSIYPRRQQTGRMCRNEHVSFPRLAPQMCRSLCEHLGRPRSLALPPLHLFFLPPTSTCLLADSECWVPRAFLSRWGSGGRPPGHGPLCPHTLLCSPFAHAATTPRFALGKAPRVGWRSCDLSATSLIPSFPRTLEQRLPVHGPRCPAERPRFGAGVGGVVHPAWAFSWKLSFLKGPCFLITAIDACALVTA